MKKSFVMMWILLVISLVGCSDKGISVAIDFDSALKLNDKIVNLQEYNGRTATAQIENIATVEYYICEEPKMCSHADSDYNWKQLESFKSSKYYTRYLGYQIILFRKSKDCWIECKAELFDNDEKVMQDVIQQMYDTAGALTLSENIDTIVLGSDIIVKTKDRAISVTNESITVNDVIIYKKKELDILNIENAVEEFNGHVLGVMKDAASGRKYYMYNEYIIEVSGTTILNDYIVLR